MINPAPGHEFCNLHEEQEEATPEDSPKPLGRYYHCLAPRMRQDYVDALDRIDKGDYSMPEVEAWLEKNRPPTKAKKRK